MSGIAKCRLDVWRPTIVGTTFNKWVTALNPEGGNALTSVFIIDKLANPRYAEIILSNRAKDFTSSSTFVYNYKDSEGASLGNFSIPEKHGVLTSVFHDFMHARLVDVSNNQVMFAGRIKDVDVAFENRFGETIKLKMIDALEELQTVDVKGLLEKIIFYKAGDITSGHDGHSITDMVKAFIACAYKKEYLPFKTTDVVTGYNHKNSSKIFTVDQLIAETIYAPSDYTTGIVTDDTGTASIFHRFQEESQAISTTKHIDWRKTSNRGLLGEILRTLQTAPKESQQNNEKFGWDYYVDPNISYGGHANFLGKNLDPATEPPPAMFNTFKRGERIADSDPATYGLTVRYPAATNVETQGHRDATGLSVQYATKPMSGEFNFTRPKDKLFSSVLLKYNDAKEKKEDSEEGKEQSIVLYIVYVTEISGQFMYGNMAGSGNTATVQPKLIKDPEIAAAVGTYVSGTSAAGSEYLDLYASDGTTMVKLNVGRVQYQSHTTITGSANYGYLLISDIDADLLTRANGNYVLKGVGDSSGAYASSATCKIDLSTSIASKGFPRRVWGWDRQTTLSRGSVTEVQNLRQECAALLSRSSKDIVDAKFSFTGPPIYYVDMEIATLQSSGSVGQRVQFQDVGVPTQNTPGTRQDVGDYGFRQGMLMVKMNSSFTSPAQTSGGKDIYGYCFGMEDFYRFDVDLTENESFAVGDNVRLYIPLRAGDTIRVENLLADIAGNHLITEIEYTEEPNQMTRIKSTGVNEGIGLEGVKYLPIISGARDESDTRFNIPEGHQTALWTGLFSSVDGNTVQWQTVGGEADVVLSNGSVYSVDVSTSSNNNTTHATTTDKEGTVFGIANASHPVAGDSDPGLDKTVYYIYLDPNREGAPAGEKSHFYTRPATAPQNGSDEVYTQDGDNIIVGWMRAAQTSDGLAEFGVYKDSSPGEGKHDAALTTQVGTATSALLKKGAQTFNTDLMIEASTWANDLARREVKWHGGEKSDGSQDTVNATIQMADGDNRTIAYGGDSGDNGSGAYRYTSNGSSYSNQGSFTDNKTYYAFIDFTENPTGDMLLRWTDTISVPYGDNRVLLSMIVVPPDNTKGRSPLIFPLGTKSLSINAVVIAANSIIGDHIQAGTIATDHITGTIAGNKLSIDANTTFSSGYDPSTKAKTTANNTAPGSPGVGDLWIDLNSTPANKLYRWSGSAWVEFDLGLARARADDAFDDAADAQGTANSKRTTFAQSSTPSALAAGDVWIDIDNHKMYTAAGTGMGSGSPPNNVWVLRDDAGAINSADTSINGGRIATQVIILKAGGGTILEDGTETSGAGASRVTLSNTGIFGYDASSDFQFKMQATDGKAAFDGGAVLLDDNGMNLYTSAGGTLKTRINNDGIEMITGPTTGLVFKDSLPSGSVKAQFNTDGNGSSGYGSNSHKKLVLWSDRLDITLEAVAQDIGLFPDQTYGYVKVGDRPFVFMDSTSRTSGLHSSTMDFVGWWKKNGSVSYSTVYRLPWRTSSSSPADGQVLAIDGSPGGSGIPTDPYTFDLEWVDAGGSAAPFLTSTNTGMYTGGSNVINFNCNNNTRVQFNTSGINMVGGNSSSYIYGVHIIRTNNGTASAPSYTFNPNNDTSGMYYSSGVNISYSSNTKMRFGSFEVTCYDDFRPSTNDTYDLGGSGARWDDVYATNGTINTSDEREKTNILPATLGLSFVNDLNPVSFKWKNTESKNKETHYGLVAQEVIQTLKTHGIDSSLDFGGICGSEDTTYGARYTEFVSILIKAVQELSERITVLEGGQ